jgi:hypothetical protein
MKMTSEEFNSKMAELLDDVGPEVIMCMVADYVGWSIAIPGEPEEPVHGMVLGTQDFITMIFGVKPEDFKVPDRNLLN